MRNSLALVGVGALVIAIGTYAISLSNSSPESSMTSSLTLTSSVFENGASIPSRFTCDGDNTSPPLFWSGVPEDAVSLALIMDDPDVPRALRPDGVFDHWVLFNIPPETSELRLGGTAGVVGANGAGRSQYTGPCPPPEYEPSEHRYFFRLYALDTELSLEAGAEKTEVLGAMEGHILGQAELMGRYRRAGE